MRGTPRIGAEALDPELQPLPGRVAAAGDRWRALYGRVLSARVESMPILAPSHDYAHPVESDAAWSESYYFNAYDPASRSGFFTRVGIRPNEGTMDVSLSAWLPGGQLAEYRHVVDQHEMVGSPLVVGGVRYQLVDALKTWRI